MCCRHRVRVRVMGAAGTGPAFIRVRGDAGNTLVREALAKQQMAATYIDSRPALRRPLLSAPECRRLPRAPASLGQPALATTALWFRHSQPRSASLRALDTHAGAASGRRAAGAGTLQACRWGRWCTVREAAAGEVGTCDGRRREAEGGALDRAGSIQRAAARAQVRATAAAAFRRALPTSTCTLARTPQNFRLNLPATQRARTLGNLVCMSACACHVVMCGICKQNSLARLFPNHHNKHNT